MSKLEAVPPRARPAPSGARACGSLHRLERSEGAWRLDCRFRGNDKGAASEPELAEPGMVVRARPTGQRNVRSVSAIGRSLMLAIRRRLLDETAVELTRPFALEERDDRGPSLDEFDSISPGTVLGVSERHTLRVAAVPGIPQTALLRGGLGREWRQGRAGRHGELGMGMSGSLQIGRAIPNADVQANGAQYPISALIAGAAIRGPRSAMAYGGQAMSESSSVRLDSAAGAGAASNCRMSGGPQARPTVGLIHWQSFAKNFMFFCPTAPIGGWTR